MKNLFILLLFLSSVSVNACCLDDGTLNFCSFLKDETLVSAFKGEITEIKKYSRFKRAFYVKVIRQYDNKKWLTATVKLYEEYRGISTDYRFSGDLAVGDTLLIAMNWENKHRKINNPDWWREWHTELIPEGCQTVILEERKGVIYGKITNDVWEFPAADFEQHLEKCDFPIDPDYQHPCLIWNNYAPQFLPTPNLVELNIESDSARIEVKNKYGIIVFQTEFIDRKQPFWLTKSQLDKGLNFVEITCNGRKHYFKVLN